MLMVLSIVDLLGCFWSWGVMHNYATEMAKRRSSYTGGFYDLTEREVEAVPDWIAGVNLLFSLGSVALLVTGIVLFW